jgi:putative flippase GtrA
MNHAMRPGTPPNNHNRTYRRVMAGEFIRFIIVRGLCTVLSYGLYLLLLLKFSYESSYVVAFVVGVLVAYLVNSKFVFREPLRKRAALRFPLVYVFQFFANLILLRVAVEYLHIPATLALAVSIAITIPITFLLSRWVIRAG